MPCPLPAIIILIIHAVQSLGRCVLRGGFVAIIEGSGLLLSPTTLKTLDFCFLSAISVFRTHEKTVVHKNSYCAIGFSGFFWGLFALETGGKTHQKRCHLSISFKK
jgi:hypothetical protein